MSECFERPRVFSKPLTYVGVEPLAELQALLDAAVELVEAERARRAAGAPASPLAGPIRRLDQAISRLREG